MLTRRRILEFAMPVATMAATAASSAAPAGPPSARLARLQHNENPFGPSKRALEAMAAAIADSWMYADEETEELRRAIAAREGLAAENVIITEGSAELLKLVALIQAGADREVIAARPTYVMLPQYAAQRGGTVAWVNLDRDFKLDLATMQSRIGARTNVLYLCNPNNPSGTVVDAKTLRAFIGSVPGRPLVVVDEAYLDLVDGWPAVSMVDQVKAGRNVLISRSFSKLHALAGQRIGYGLGQSELIRQLQLARLSRPNRLGIIAALASHSDVEFQEYSRRAIQSVVSSTSALFDELGVRYVPSCTNFMMFDTGGRSQQCVEFMRSRGVLIRPILEAPGTWARVSMGRPEAMQAFAVVARAFFKK